MTSGPTYGQGFVDLEPRLDTGFLARINSQLDRAFSNIRLDIDDQPIRNIARSLETVESSARNAEGELEDMARRSGDVEANIRNLAGHLDISEDEARRLAQQIIRTQDNTALLERSALETARAMGLSEAEARKFANTITRIDDQPLRRIDSSLSRIRSSLVTAAAGAAAFFGVRGAIGFATAARDSFTALEESVNAVNVVFDEGADQIFDFGERVAESAGLARSEFQQMSTVLGSALINAGFTADEAAAKTINLTQRAADMASVFNTDVQQALGAIQAALRGEADPIERFGVSLAATAVEAEAAALGFSRVGGEFDATAKAAARLSLIMEQTDRVQGDFVNTSDSLANRSRINAAQFENLRAELGEKLLPVFEALVEAGPAVIEGLGDLAPSLGAIATSASNLAKSTPGVIDFVDALHLLTDLPRGIGQLFDGVNLQMAVLFQNTEGINRSLRNTLERVNTQGLVDDLRKGEKAALALANRLAEVGQKGELDPQFIEDLSTIAGTDFTETTTVFALLVEEADRLGLTADEVENLRLALAGLLDEARADGPIRNVSERFERFPEIARDAGRGFETFAERVEEAGLSLADAAFSTEDAAVAFRNALTDSEELALTLEAIGSSAQVAAGFLDDNLRPALVNAGDAVEDLNRDGRTTANEFIQNLRDMTAAALTFRADLANIARISPELAREIGKLPDDVAQQIIDGFRDNPAKILEAEEALLGAPDEIAETIRSIVGEAMELMRADPGPGVKENFQAVVVEAAGDIPGAVPAITDILQGVLDVSFADLEGPDTQDLILDSIRGWSSVEIAAAVNAAMQASVRSIDVDLTAAGREARGTFIAGLSQVRPGETKMVQDSIIRVIDGAIIRQSPPKLFLDAGVDSGDAFWQGFSGSALDFRMADLRVPPPTGTFATDTDFGGGNQFTVTVNNPVGEPTEDSLQAALIEVAVSPTVNRLVSAGSSR